jgi:dihydroxyacetone kinase DhaKLM complex PTS-EIIA-like component DhaM
MGVRSALDHVMDKILGADMGSFEANLHEMVKRGHITANQRDNLAIVIDAGSASTHRGFRPPRDLLDEMLAVMENIIRAHYITGPMLATAKTSIPPRPPRSRKP